MQSPWAPESYSALAGEPLLLLDFGRGDLAGSAGLEHALVALEQLPCASIALAAATLSADAQRLSARCDLAIADPADLEPVVEALHGRPLASLALVQLLRLGEHLDAHAGLIAESLVYSTLQSGPEFAEWCASRPVPRAARESSAPAVLIERSGERLHLTLNRPDKRNAFSAAMRDALAEGLRTAAADPELQVLLDGAGPAFCSGGDLDEFGTLPDPATAHAVRSTRNPARLLAALSKRVTAHVHGACVGAGAELPAFARHVRAAEDAFFQLPEIGMGLVPGAGGTVSLPRRIGRQRAAWWALSGARIDARTALSWGLVDEIA